MANILGDEILRQRLALGLSITELSDISDVSIDIISRLETGERKFIIEKNFNKLNTVLDLSDYREYIYDISNELLSSMIRSARKEAGLSQKELAYRCEYKCKSTISHLESGRYSRISYDSFLRLKDVLHLDEEEFEPFIQKKENPKGRVIIPNRELIQKLVTEKRNQLHISQVSLASMADVNSCTIVKLEIYPEQKVQNGKLMKVIKALKFTKEEILACFENMTEEDLKVYFLEKPKSK